LKCPKKEMRRRENNEKKGEAAERGEVERSVGRQCCIGIGIHSANLLIICYINFYFLYPFK
jgi:hypothetical protein